MAKINSSSSKIQEVDGFGVKGYRVEFSIKDLWALRRLADCILENCTHEISPERTLAEIIGKLCNSTIGYVDADTMDFLKKEEGAE